MKLRARLALTLGVATISLLVLLGWAQSSWRSQLRAEALAEAALNRMESGERERCEANPERWPGPRGERRSHRGPDATRHQVPPHRVFAYDRQFRSRNPDNPAFPEDLARQLREGKDLASDRSAQQRSTQVAVRMPWNDGPCAVVLMRAKGPPSWFSRTILMPAFLVALVMVLVALFAAGPIVRRVRLLTEAVRKLGDGSEEPIRVEGSDEIAELGSAFEQSRQTIEAQLRSLRERETALRNYIANTTHDVMLPLSVLQGHLVSLQQRIEAGESLDSKSIVPSIEEAQYLGSLLHNLNAVARLEANEGLAHRDALDLNRLVERVVERHRPIAKRRQVGLELAVPEHAIEFCGDLTLLEQALGNIVQNAIRYNRPKGHVAVILAGSEQEWTLKVVDDGPGIRERDRPRVVEPAYRGSEARTRHPHGMGLGLHIASDVAIRHGLSLTLSDTADGGLTVELAHPGR
ncbi:MAG: HAMP domain-containing sensor histidine kinase [Polyangiales bacterium]